MRTASKYKAALALIALLALLIYCGLSGGWLGAVTPITPIPSTDTGPQFITDVNNALAILQQNETTALSVLTPEVLAPTIANLGSVSGTVTCNVAQSSGCQMTLTGPVTSFSLSGGTPGQLITLQINQGASGGATLSWPSAVQWEGPAPVINQTPGATQLYELQTFDGVTWYPLVHSSLTGNAITGTGYLPAIAGFNGIVQGALNVMAYGATGSPTNATATTTSGSASATLSTAGDFQNGQHVVLMHAGAVTSLATPAAPTVKAVAEGTSVDSLLEPEYNYVGCAADSSSSPFHNANCTTSWTYQIVNVDGNRGMTAPSPATTITNGPATLSAQNRIVVTWDADPNAVETLLYSCSGSSCTPTLLAVVPALPSVTGYLWSFNKSCAQSPSGSPICNGYIDMGATGGNHPEAFAYDETLGTALPSGATNQNLYTTITAGAGATAVTLANAPSVSSSTIAMWHDDAPAFNSAISQACGEQQSPNPATPRSRQVLVPPGTYMLGESLNFFACMGVRMTCASGGVDIGYANNCYLGWHGANAVIDLNQAGGTVIENFTIPGVEGFGSTPSLGINMDANTTNAVLDPGATGTTNAGGYSVSGQSSTNILRNIYIGTAGVGVSIARTTDDLNEKMWFENVQMGAAPAGPDNTGLAGGYIGYYTSGWNAALMRVIGGMVADRVMGLMLNRIGSVVLNTLNFESDVVDIYASDTIGAGSGWVNETGSWSECAEHHLYSPILGFGQGYRATGNLLSASGGSLNNCLLPNQFYLMPGQGGLTILIGNTIATQQNGGLIAVEASVTATCCGRALNSSIISIGNQYGTMTPWYPTPAIGPQVPGNSDNIVRLNVTSIEDIFGVYANTYPNTEISLSHGIQSNNAGAAFLGGTTQLQVASLAPPNNMQVSPQGTLGSTTYTYYAACKDAFGNLTAGSAAGSTTTGNATLSSANYINVQTDPEPGCVASYWWRNGTAASDMFAVMPGNTVNDTGVNALNGATQIAMPAATQQGVLAAGSLQNGCSGSAALASGTVTVNNACITGSRPIFVSGLNDTNHVYVSAQSAGSATVKSTSSTDAATVYWAQN
jgi:hypothetical protein